MDLKYPQKANGLYILNSQAFENIAVSALREYCPKSLESPTRLDVDGFLEEYLGLMLKYAYLGIPGYELLGITIMSTSAEIPVCNSLLRPEVSEETYGTVLITTQLCGARHLPRCRYTKMHEGGHWMLQQPYFQQKEKQGSGMGIVACRTVEKYHSRKQSDHDWLEWQADSLAAALLMPKQVFLDYTRSMIQRFGVSSGYLKEWELSDRAVFHEIIGNIASIFGVSRRAAQIRMIHLGLIKLDRSRLCG